MELDIVLVLLFSVALLAGWVDAVVGGGGLLQLPALMLAYPQAPVATLLGTNKLASVFATSTAAITYGRKIKLDHRLLWPTVGLALVGSGLGAAMAGAVSSGALRPIIIAVLMAVAIMVLARPQFGLHPQPKLKTPLRAAALMLAAGLLVAFYDGIIGPGTGIFLAICFAAILGSDYVSATAHAKVINAATNLGALLVFIYFGHVWWALGLLMAIGNATGALIGANMALRNGSKFVRIVLIVVVFVLIARLSYDTLMDFLNA
ncbi:TSUP family transporter [Natronoglycomyces albus]|uniref:Probable membrane transporter protein n=1 Tax=Natronoglycomyces albus TaxID=2811108 RepID=A0A895XJP2_9ACTN|nr:TSUP family transporter [Natronoglycomyces albus]QSB05227.1 TSUP family transporter [Natronoglycomyces albus]